MNKYARLISLLIAVVLFSGCATQASLSIYSKPEGAYITEVGTKMQLGMAPVAIWYNAALLNQHKDAEGCFWSKDSKRVG